MKRIRTILAILLIAAMALTGCKYEKDTMFTIMEEAGEIEKYYYELRAKLESNIPNFENIEIVLNGKHDGERVALGFEIDYALFNLKIEDLIIADKDTVYINVGKVLRLVEAYTGYDVEDTYGIELEWLELPVADGLLDMADTKEYTGLMCKMLEEALADNEITDKSSTHTVVIESFDDIITFVENLAESVDNNKEDIIELIAAYDENAVMEAYKDTIELCMDAAVSGIMKFNEEYQLGITDEEIEGLRAEAEEALSEVGEELEAYMDADMEAAAEELLYNLDVAFADFVEGLEVADEDMGELSFTLSNSMTGKEREREYSVEFVAEMSDADSDEMMKLTVEYVLTEAIRLRIEAPKDVTTLEELVYIICECYYEDYLTSVSPIYEPTQPTIEEPTQPATEEPTESFEGKTISHVPVKQEQIMMTGLRELVVIYYDSAYVQPDLDFSMLNEGQLCMELVEDDYMHLFIYVDDIYTSSEDYCYWQTEIYDGAEVTKMYDLSVGNIIINRFDINHGDYTEQFFYIDLGNGDAVFGNSTDFTSGYSDLTMDEFLSYVFGELHLAIE